MSELNPIYKFEIAVQTNLDGDDYMPTAEQNVRLLLFQALDDMLKSGAIRGWKWLGEFYGTKPNPEPAPEE